MNVQDSELKHGWRWKERNMSIISVVDELKHVNDWTEAESLPSEIHVELLKLGRIPDPYVGFNEHRVQWIGEREWLWDWGPELMTVGPYRPIRFLTYRARIADLYPRATVNDDNSASLSVNVTLRGKATAIKSAQVVLRDGSGKEVKKDAYVVPDYKAETELGLVTWEFTKSEIKLWWPVGYGEQPLYHVETVLLGENGYILDQQHRTFGFRRVALIQEPLTEADRHGTGTTFLFEVNGIRIFIGGSNWVPADNFLTTITPERYRAWLQLLKEGNQNMVRVWGGGVHEPNVFYDICDELGILVWQDFQFACGVYPAHEAFVANVKAEAEENVRRLRHHPSIALFCGNNEDYQQVTQWGGITDLPARKIYENILPEVVTSLTNDDVPYHRGSPYGGKGWDTADPTVGDIHQWDVWAGAGRNYQDYDLMGGRFISEFGMPAMPNIRTIDYWLQDDAKQRYAQSRLLSQHNKAGNHERRFAQVMNENFRVTAHLETHVYNTQIMQAEALGWAYRSWRREWKGPGKQFTAGAIVWQLNDCWPVTSWAIADYFLRPKPAYYVIARELESYTVGLLRTVQKSRECDRPRQYYDFGAFPSIVANIEVWGTNATLKPKNVKLDLSFVDLESDWQYAKTSDVTLEPNQSTELISMRVPEPPINKAYPFAGLEPQRTRTQAIVISARLLDGDTGEVLSRIADWPQPYRHVDFPVPGLSISVSGEKVRVEVKRPIKGLVLDVLGDTAVRWSDNAIDVMPGDPQEVVAKGLRDKVTVSYMGSERSMPV